MQFWKSLGQGVGVVVGLYIGCRIVHVVDEYIEN